ncbi:flagellar hook capping FlgD N-terminal domain-containing protein [Tropicimonas marinistellae]|uniref:flagellar hook capping FlgD N-terminal domain-containing protein n=1 Tax=Tropicimonas marinistellae TaxID=1739787 RepID=UPI00082DD8EE|nr:flagellar hook capping FlgD N-terminal domain-containing protein [Tropicimonas marinistellae]
MDTTATTTISTADAASLSTTTSSTSASAISSDFETFLKMMTAQIENQDPLNPLDSSDFATQLATFSGVEQQVKTNDLLTEMLAQSDALELGQMASWIGERVRVASTVAYEGDPIPVWAAPDSTAASAELVVYDSSGTEVNRLGISTDEATVEWNGTNADGDGVSWGTYSFAVESYDTDGTLLSSEQAEIYSEVIEARTDGTAFQLVLDGGIEVDATDVTAIRTAG